MENSVRDTVVFKALTASGLRVLLSFVTSRDNNRTEAFTVVFTHVTLHVGNSSQHKGVHKVNLNISTFLLALWAYLSLHPEQFPQAADTL